MKKALYILICLIVITVIAALIMTGCNSPTFDPINPLTLTSIGTKGNFQAQLVSNYPDNDYINNAQTWCYNVTILAKKGDLSHWCLDLCDEPKHEVLNWSGPAEKIEHTAPTWNGGAYGHIIKWDGTTLGPGESAIFCFTLEGLWESTQVEWFAFDGAPWGWEDPQFADTGWITGPSCTPLCILPIAGFHADKNEVCSGDEIVFTDSSIPDDITAWSWSFPGGNPSNSDTQGPNVVAYNSTGVFSVSLTVINACGSHTETKTGYITVKDCAPAPQTYNLTISSTAGGSATATVNPTTVVGPGETKTIFDVPANTTVNLAASAHTGYDFVNWTGSPIDGVTDAATIIVMQDNYAITANFKAIPITPPPPVTVGWETYPINALAVLAPWIALFAVITISSIILLVLKRRRT